MADQVLAIDAGTTSIRASVVGADGTRRASASAILPPSTGRPGRVELDPVALGEAAVELSEVVLRQAGPVAAVGIANQRCSTIVWERATGRPIGPGIGWQDNRTVRRCDELRRAGLDVSPHGSLTKAEWLLRHTDRPADELCVGTVDSWLVWVLTGGRAHITDTTNADTGRMATPDVDGWDPARLRACAVPEASMPRIVPSSGVVAEAVALPGAPPIAGLAGDQQASLVGLGCTAAGAAKATLGTGAMVGLCSGTAPPPDGRDLHGSLVLAGWRDARGTGWMVEGTMLACGSALEWLRRDAGWFESFQEIDALAAEARSAGGVVFVPALHGLGTPSWDSGARGCILGLRASTTRAELARAVLEGLAHRVADLVDAAERASGRTIAELRADGGLTASVPLVRAVADAIGRPVQVSTRSDATTLGAALLAGGAVGVWPSWDHPTAPASRFTPVLPVESLDRQRWAEACRRAAPL